VEPVIPVAAKATPCIIEPLVRPIAVVDLLGTSTGCQRRKKAAKERRTEGMKKGRNKGLTLRSMKE
jgi:hypothetical protein